MAQRYINEPSVEKRTEQPYVGIAVTVSPREGDKVNEITKEIFEWLDKNKVKPAGPLFCRYWTVDVEEEICQAEVGVPVERMVTEDEHVIAGFIPAGSYVTAVHYGHPEHLEKSFNELEIWAKKEGLELDKRWEGEEEIWNGRFQWYLTAPDSEPDPAKWKIQLSYLLMRDEAA